MDKIIITCEHGGNKIPAKYAPFFKGKKAVLNSHRGYDIGSIFLFELLSKKADYSNYSDVSRLLVELNRSLHHKKLFSEYTEALALEEKQSILSAYYFPYRNEVEKKINSWIKNKHRVLHISVHSFIPELDGVKRNNDIGFLFDSGRKFERDICKKWKSTLLSLAPDLIIRFNYPYLGKADGFTTYLRKKFNEKQYLGIELEVNQKYFIKSRIINISEIVFQSFNNLFDK